MFNNTYSKKKVLVTGHTGFKGSWLSQWLLNLGAEVYGYSLYIPSNPSLYQILNLKEKTHSQEQHDIRNQDDFFKTIEDNKPEILFHLAAMPIVRECYEKPHEAFSTNVMGTINVLEALRRYPFIKSAVLITSDKCYENVEWEYGYRETDRLGGKDPYSASKAAAELAISTYFKSYLKPENHRLGIASVRAGNVIGGGDWAKDRIVPDCFRAWSQNEVVTIRSPLATRPWQHVLDPLSGYLQLGSDLYSSPNNLSGEAFNFGPPAEVIATVQELIEGCQTYWKNGGEFQIDEGQGQKQEASLLKLCCDKALMKLNWMATATYDETVRMTSQWYQNYYDHSTDMSLYTSNQIKEYENLAKERQRSWTKK